MIYEPIDSCNRDAFIFVPRPPKKPIVVVIRIIGACWLKCAIMLLFLSWILLERLIRNDCDIFGRLNYDSQYYKQEQVSKRAGGVHFKLTHQL